LKPVTISAGPDNFAPLLEEGIVSLEDESLPDGWINFYREDDVSATAYFYLDKPVSGLPAWRLLKNEQKD